MIIATIGAQTLGDRQVSAAVHEGDVGQIDDEVVWLDPSLQDQRDHILKSRCGETIEFATHFDQGCITGQPVGHPEGWLGVRNPVIPAETALATKGIDDRH